MKYLSVFAVLAIAFWIWRHNRVAHRSKTTAAQPQPTPPSAQAMVQCTTCAVHLPATDAVQGKRGPYCSPAHRAQLEG